MAYERLVTKLTKENLWLYVLTLLTERPMYAYEMCKEIKGRFGFSPATVTVYVVMYKMRREGLIELAEEREQDRKPRRKYYEATELGRQTLVTGKRFLEETINLLS